MASSKGVWGIDIGQCALKALRCTLAEDGKTVLASAFDYIEYPKLLSQPEAEPDELIREALQTFLSRNDVRGDKVAISVSGQSGLSRFIKLPPVESKKIPDIVRYEARQQIPFPLDEVIWDYQQLAGGSEEEGFTLETEVGLFAMKRDQVFKAIRPFDRADMELDIIQLSPLCIYNVVCHDFLTNLPPPDQYDPEDPPESVVVISLGTDTTDLVVTNGYRVWQRNIPLGGNHFTRALTKELKLTFAKAEHLKRNAREAEDPKKVFQAMRPVFNDLVTEVQRSISFFQSIDRRAKIGNVIALGNAMRLPGLQQYLSKNLGYDVIEVGGYPKLSGQGVVGAPAFKENLLSFSVCYGLCLQGLKQGALSTNLLPRELVVQRTIREKKPWAVATVALLLLGLAFNFFFLNRAWTSVNTARADFTRTLGEVNTLKSKDEAAAKKDTELNDTATYLKSLGSRVVDNSERRLLWPELLAAITKALPYDPKLDDLNDKARIWTAKELPLDQRADLHIIKIDSEYYNDLSQWFNADVQKRYDEGKRAAAGLAPEETPADAPPPADAVPPTTPPAPDPAAAPPTTPPAAPGAAAAPAEGAGPTGKGWVVELQGYHDYSENDRNRGAQYVRETLLKKIEETEIDLPVGPGRKETQTFTLKELGVTHPVMVWNSGPAKQVEIDNPNFEPAKGAGAGAAGGEENGGAALGLPLADKDNPPRYKLGRFYFVIQFAWSDPEAHTVSKRLEKQESEKAAKPGATGTDGSVAAGGA